MGERTARRRLFGRRQGRSLSPRQRRLYEQLLPALRVDPANERIREPASLFGAPVEAVWLEIGFGGGEHLVWQARNNRSTGIIGCEPFINGVAKLLCAVEEYGLENVALHDDDALDILTALPEGSVARIFLLFPDPWPKKRHHKRRLINGETVNLMARALCAGGELRIASDDAGYVFWILRHLVHHGDFHWRANAPGDWRERPRDWPETRYEQRARRLGLKPVFLSFTRIGARGPEHRKGLRGAGKSV